MLYYIYYIIYYIIYIILYVIFLLLFILSFIYHHYFYIYLIGYESRIHVPVTADDKPAVYKLGLRWTLIVSI